MAASTKANLPTKSRRVRQGSSPNWSFEWSVFRWPSTGPLYASPMRTFLACAVIAVLLAPVTYGQKAVSFPTSDGGVVSADSYGAGEHAVVLAHGGRFNKGSWEKQAQAFDAAGFSVRSIAFRRDGPDRG